uniref:DUF393 domain-containing protein n=1 Tax=Chrysocystis fragilis TaxID=1411660 RepID=A0A7S0TA94_9STRA|mmetsp:Transcript_1048/g.3074  ORF Transcript_1048/g.3074 Transcript_1048/m.3074 type:complete len:310 (+) Transcript_1048:57-986(+)
MKAVLMMITLRCAAALVPRTGIAKPVNLFTARESRPVVLYDGTCPRCNAWVNFLLEHDTGSSLRYAAIGSPVGQALMDHVGLPRDADAVLLVDREQYYLRSEAFLKILERTNLARYASLGWLVPRPVRDALLRANRERFGESEQCFVEALDDRFVSSLPPSGGFFRDDDRPILVFDGSCPLCSAWVDFVVSRNVDVRFAAAQTAAGRALKDFARADRDVLVLVARDRAFENADAVFELCARASDPLITTSATLLRRLLPAPARAAIFDLVSKRRRLLHLPPRSDRFCRVSDPDKADRFLLDLDHLALAL